MSTHSPSIFPIKETGNKINGKFTIREYRNGAWKVKDRSTYKDGTLHGPYIRYKCDYITVGNYYQGKKHGTIKRLSKNGKFQSAKMYLFGIKTFPTNLSLIKFPLEIIYYLIDLYMGTEGISNLLRIDKEYLRGFHSLFLLNKKINLYMQKYAKEFNILYAPHLFPKYSRYSKKSKITELMCYNLNGTKQGEYKLYDEREKIYLERSTYHCGLLHGDCTTYDSKTDSFWNGKYVYGKKEGEFTNFVIGDNLIYNRLFRTKTIETYEGDKLISKINATIHFS